MAGSLWRAASVMTALPLSAADAVATSPPIRLLSEGRDGAFDAGRIARVDRTQFDSQSGCRGLQRAKLPATAGRGGIASDCDAREPRRHLPKQIKPFAADAPFKQNEAGGIAAGTR